MERRKKSSERIVNDEGLHSNQRIIQIRELFKSGNFSPSVFLEKKINQLRMSLERRTFSNEILDSQSPDHGHKDTGQHKGNNSWNINPI